MPACVNFQGEGCYREHCPYRHVKVSTQAPLCQAFSHVGYCADGNACVLRHEYDVASTLGGEGKQGGGRKRQRLVLTSTHPLEREVGSVTAVQVPTLPPAPTTPCATADADREVQAQSSPHVTTPSFSIRPNFLRTMDFDAV